MPTHTLHRDDFRLRHRVRVRWTEVDPQNVVFNGHYLGLADLGTTEYWRALALPYPYAFERMSGDLVVRKASVEFLSPARFDDWIDVAVRRERLGRSSIHLVWGVFRAHELLAHGDLIYVFVDPKAERSASLPALLRDSVDAYEDGQPMLDIQTGAWASLADDASGLRNEVFVRELGIDPMLERDGCDGDAVHAVAYNRAGWPMGTARLLQEDDGAARIGRLAVRREMRGGGAARSLVEALLRHGRERGATRAIVHAQLPAVGLFTRLGFTPGSEPFEEAGLRHVMLTKPLKHGA